MSIPATTIEALLTEDEGVRYTVFLDTTGHPTVGIGHKVVPEDGLEVGDTITQEQVDTFFAADIKTAKTAAIKQMAEANITDMNFLPYLVSVCYQLGPNWINEFPKIWEHIRFRQYMLAAYNLTLTKWNRETPKRVAQFQMALRGLR